MPVLPTYICSLSTTDLFNAVKKSPAAKYIPLHTKRVGGMYKILVGNGQRVAVINIYIAQCCKSYLRSEFQAVATIQICIVQQVKPEAKRIYGCLAI